MHTGGAAGGRRSRRAAQQAGGAAAGGRRSSRRAAQQQAGGAASGARRSIRRAAHHSHHGHHRRPGHHGHHSQLVRGAAEETQSVGARGGRGHTASWCEGRQRRVTWLSHSKRGRGDSVQKTVKWGGGYHMAQQDDGG